MKPGFTFILSLLLLIKLPAQEAKVYEEKLSMLTYMFADPDPVPNIGRIYPYFRFDGFTSKGEKKEWNMVILENDLIKIYISPEIGGKVWGAIEKSTGKEFLYFNKVVKFRDIAMRGPWTSGGLEYNFGDIGHIPTCSTPVDYKISKNQDGSVSCFVGALDLPSRTKWNIEIRLSPGQAFFETFVSWYNCTSLPNTYYHWMNAAAKAKGNLEFIYPGTHHIGHGGEVSPWPLDNGRDVSWYRNNDFGPYKSYHVINSYTDIFGGYWHDDNFGFGHYSSYTDKPGKKLWIWGLSKQGMIWEDLLTDNDGQYIEYQAGKLFNQAAFSSTYSPYKHREFKAADSDKMHEIWFPIKETGGMVAMSDRGVLNIEYDSLTAKIFLSALQEINDELAIITNSDTITYNIKLSPLELFITDIKYSEGTELEIILGNKLLQYRNQKEETELKRPINLPDDFSWESVYGVYCQALELEKQRSYNDAIEAYLNVVELDPGYLPALYRLALGYYRKMEYDKALEYAFRCLSINTYDSEANYIYGLINFKLGEISEAKSAFSIATQSPLSRTSAYLELAKLFLLEKDYSRALSFAEKSLEFNSNNLSSREVIVVAGRLNASNRTDGKGIANIYELDPLSVLAGFEEYLAGSLSGSEFQSRIKNEFPFESYLELAIKYYKLGDTESSLKVLEMSTENLLVNLWKSYLKNDNSDISRILENPSGMVFPHRTETAEMLQSLIKKNDSWLLKYYLGLIYWNRGLEEKAKQLFDSCKSDPDTYWFWLAKSELFKDTPEVVTKCLKRAYKLEPGNWRVVLALSEDLIKMNRPGEAVKISERILPLERENAKLGLIYSKALYRNKQYVECLSFLEDFVLLPYEGSVDGKMMYSEVCTRLSVERIVEDRFKEAKAYAEQAKEWPDNLGVGKPYDVDERLENYLLAYASELGGEALDYSNVSKYKRPEKGRENSKVYLQLLAYKKEGRKGEALILIEKLIKEDPGNIYLNWSKARFTGDKNASVLENKILSSDITVSEYDTRFVDRDFRFLIEILNYLNL